MTDPGSEFFHPDPGSRSKRSRSDPGSRSEFKYFQLKNCFPAPGKMILDVHPESRIRIFFPSRIQGSKGTEYRIRIHNTGSKQTGVIGVTRILIWCWHFTHEIVLIFVHKLNHLKNKYFLWAKWRPIKIMNTLTLQNRYEHQCRRFVINLNPNYHRAGRHTQQQFQNHLKSHCNVGSLGQQYGRWAIGSTDLIPIYELIPLYSLVMRV